MASFLRSFIGSFAAMALLGGCAAHNPDMWERPKFPKASVSTDKLRALPPAGQKVAVAVYGFTDQTGQFKQTDGAQTLSRAVTQGATSILVKSLHEAGQRGWFTVIEREKIDNVLRERAVIREMRSSYLGEKTLNPQALPPLLFAGVLLEGGIVGYDTNTKTGGSGSRFLGIGGSTQYREDTVTVYLRAVSVKTGEVLSSVSIRKSIASVAVNASAFRYVAFRELLELESGITYNEPDELALQQAIDAAIYALIMEGSMQDLWCFNTTADYAADQMQRYIADRDSTDKKQVSLPLDSDGQAVTGQCRSAQANRPRTTVAPQVSQAKRTTAQTPRNIARPVVQTIPASEPIAASTEPKVSNKNSRQGDDGVR
ncbi:MAG: CsgG/HfaB family protein [Pontixanthobacter sp.]